MKNGIKIIAAFALAFSGLLGGSAMVNHVVASTAIQCGCGNSSCHGGCRLRQRNACQTCQTDCGCVACPQCDQETCKLELDKSKVKKTCFKVEQKTICIPKVRMPWQACCPPSSSKTRSITVLKKHTYECPDCSYKWTVQKPEVQPAVHAVQPQHLHPAPVVPIGEFHSDTYIQPVVPPQTWQTTNR
jgi:hypothetical protein